MSPGDADGQRPASRAHRRVALAAALLLGGLIAAVAITSSSGSPEGDAGAPPSCLEAWNADVEALNYGVHNSISHGYREVQVGYMPDAGSASLATDPDGECAVVFAANQLDPESQAAGQILQGGRWVPLSGLLDPADLADLQSAAVAAANATVTEYGKLEAKGTH
jgi:hypothetical protein